MANFTINDRHLQPSTAQKEPSLDAVFKKPDDGIKGFGDAPKPTLRYIDEEDEAANKYSDEDINYLDRSKTAFEISDDYFNNNIRPKLNNSIRAFHNEHRTGSHLSSSSKQFTSKIYRPKTRATIAKYEAAAAAAFFSNSDIVSIEPENPSDKMEIASAESYKKLIQYRLTKSIPWYPTLLGAFQDAKVQGLTCAYVYWKTKIDQHVQNEINDAQSNAPKFSMDQPCIDIIALEHIRFDPSADWIDIVNTSPYLIILHPMYICDLREEIASGYFNEVSDDAINNAVKKEGVDTRTARANTKQDPQAKASQNIKDFEIVMVQEHIHRIEGHDQVWFTLDTIAMLKSPVPIEEIYFHGQRPIVIGSTIIETHNPYVSSTPELMNCLQEEINEIANQRLNNVKLMMNKKYIIKSDSEVDLQALLRNQPGSAVYAQDPEKDVRELETPDVTQSSYLEQDRLNADFDDLAGNFSPQSNVSSRSLQDTVRGGQLLNSKANMLLEYELRTFTERFVIPVLKLLIKLEQKYETDDVVLALIGQQAQLQKYGMDKMTDDLLNKELSIKANVGLNNTDPTIKLQKLTGALDILLKLSANPAAAQGFDMSEVSKEIFALSGYGDGMRFINQQGNPQIAQMMQEIKVLQMKLKDKSSVEATKRAIAHESNAVKYTVEMAKIHKDANQFLVEHFKDIQNSNPQNYQPENVEQPQGTPPAQLPQNPGANLPQNPQAGGTKLPDNLGM